jgi:hypothetical protein
MSATTPAPPGPSLDWLGGAAERRFRAARPDPGLAWGSVAAAIGGLPPALVDAARAQWTRRVGGEYAAAVQFAQLGSAMLAAQAPIDLIGMTSTFVTDELHHVELCARVLMELGGAVPARFEPAEMVLRCDPALTPRQLCSELVVRLCCVTEALNLPIAVRAGEAAEAPLLRDVLALIAEEEAPHATLGELWLEWAGPDLDDAERRRLAAAAADQLTHYTWLWHAPPGATAAEHALRSAMAPDEQAATARRTVTGRILPKLARWGIDVAAPF